MLRSITGMLKRIEESPPYDPDKTIPREYETRLHDCYGYPYYYWQ